MSKYDDMQIFDPDLREMAEDTEKFYELIKDRIFFEVEAGQSKDEMVDDWARVVIRVGKTPVLAFSFVVNLDCNLVVIRSIPKDKISDEKDIVLMERSASDLLAVAKLDEIEDL